MPPSRLTLPSLAVPLLAVLLIGPSSTTSHAQEARASAKGTEAAPRPSTADIERARRVLRSTPLVDGHNDLPWAIRESSKAPHDVEAYDHSRIARTLGVSEQESQFGLHQARLRLRQLLAAKN